MSEIAWARKYRPASFDQYLGDSTKLSLMNRLSDRNNIPNTIMLYGTRGTGKTSMARLICKEILCMEPVDGHSCGKCDMCLEVAEYISSTEAGAECNGIVEIDAATTTGKADIGEIISDALIPPTWPLTKKVLILDECHMLSQAAQNSLLKVIEEPPEFLVFILCTTDPEKVIGTVQSRMQIKVEVRKKTVDELADRLEEIAKLEGVKYSKEALKIIAKKGNRIPREAITLLEDIAKSNNYRVDMETVRSSLNEVSSEVYLKFYEAANKSLSKILEFNQYLKDKDISPRSFISGLSRFTLDAMYIRYGIALDDFPPEFLKSVKDIFKTYRSSDMDTLLQVIESASKFIRADDDNNNELILTTTALRIGKIPLLAKGLSNEEGEALKENKQSIANYAKIIEDEGQRKLNKVESINNPKESLMDIFKGLSAVTGCSPVLSAVEVDVDKDKADEPIPSTTGSRRLTLEELERLMESDEDI